MGSVALLARLQVRRRYRALATLALVIGIVGGISVSLVAGSRRSSSVVDRYFRAGTHYDLNVFGNGLTRSQVLALPGVRRADPRAYLAMVARGKGSTFSGINGYAVDPAALDPMTEILRGRAPRTDDPFGVTVNESFVTEFAARVGDPVDVQMFADADDDNLNAGIYRPTGPKFRFHITGIVRTPDDVVIDDVRNVKAASQDPSNALFAPFSFYERYRSRFIDFGTAFDVQLGNPSQRASFVSAAKALAPGSPQAVAFGPTSFSQRRASIDTPVSLESSLLLGLGLALAVATLVVVALLLRAEQRARRVDDAALRALGLTRIDFGVVAALRVAPFALFGALLGAGLAVALSARYPVGVAREIELHHGLDVNLAVLAGSVLIAVGLVAGLAFVFGVAAGGRSSERGRRSRPWRSPADWLTRVGAPVDVYVGTRLAFDRDGTRSTAARPAVVGGAFALAVITALGIVAGGIGDLYRRPAAHGWPWDLVIGTQNFQLSNGTVYRLAADPRIQAQTVANYGQATIGGKTFGVLAIDPTGDAPPRVLSGRLPKSAQEIALGAKVARALHARVGSQVRFSIAGGDFELERQAHDVDTKVVGIALPPVLGDTDLGDVGIVTLDTIAAAGGAASQRFVLARVDTRRWSIAAIAAAYTPEMATDVVPARIVNLNRTKWLLVLAIVLAAALGSVVLAYTLAVGARVRARQLALLRALGMSRRRIGRVLACQGAVLALVMCVIGLPLGVIAGSVAWRVIAHQLGVGDHPVLSPVIAAAVPISIAVGLAASLLPGRRLRRGDVGRSLHAE